MGKNVVIFSDGTGQAGGLLPDQILSNIYKLYRAMRCGPDSTVDPADQLAFYDPGLGSQSDGGRIKIGLVRKLRNLISQGTGLGITANIIDCYAAILNLWRPGDRIYLFGFSRGAYTIRCVGGVIAASGVPKHMKDGSPLRYDPSTIRAIATEAVKKVYQYGASIKGDPFKELREQRAQRFREAYGSDQDGHANEFPYFIGVFDTVAALGVIPPVRIALGVVAAIVAILVAAGFAWSVAGWLFSFVTWLLIFCCILAVVALVLYFKTHLRYHPGKKRFFLANWSMKFYDNKLNRRVGYARHALSIDEARADFAYVPWVFDGDTRQRAKDEPELLRQVWFAGDHSDVGGGYIENEARLSDNALDWLLGQLRELPHRVHIDKSVLRPFPSGTGPQHDECRNGFSGIWGKLGFKWSVKHRCIDPTAPLHPSVLERFAAAEVLNYNIMMPYRPEQLRDHEQVKHYYLDR
jgi:uncharacterized protein (DUF2235 family)